MGRLMERIQTAQISRREFMKGTLAATSALALAGCSDPANQLEETTTEEVMTTTAPAAPEASVEIGDVDKAILEGKGEWIPAACWHNCGGRCLNKAYVVDGVVLRQKTDDTHEDSWDHPQNRGCIRGRSQRKHVFGADRLKYPMKRKNWSPENPNGHLRGKDEWERISWEEAISYVAGELQKAKDNYGNDSIMYHNMINLEGYMGAVLSEFGGYVDCTSCDSYGTFQYMPFLYGLMSAEVNDRYALQKSEYIVMFGHNAAWAAFGGPAYYLKKAYKAGAKFVYVGPEYNATAATFDAKWFPVRNGTDTAFMLGVAYAMLEKDAELGLIDWDFLNNYTVGFDAEHMPANARSDENFKDYLYGKYDNIAKTPEWASEICGTPVDKIYEFAKIIGKDNKVSIHSNAAPARNKAAENYPHMLMTLGAMGGHYGKEGHACGHDQNDGSFNRGPALLSHNATGSLTYPWTMANNPVDKIVPSGELWSAILDGKYHDAGNIHLMAMRPDKEVDVDIHVIYSEHHNFLQSREGMSKGIEAFRKVDFVCSQAMWLNTTAKYSDIVLPITTKWEREGDFPYVCNYDRENTFVYRNICQPMYEAKGDYEIARMISDKLGLNFESHTPFGEKQRFFNKLNDLKVMQPDGTYAPLLTITQEDIDTWGCTGTVQEGEIPLQKLLDDGTYRVKRSENDNFVYIAYKAFREDPVANPLPMTASGKFEIYCQAKSDMFDMFNSTLPTYRPVSPLPKYLETTEGYTTSFKNWETKEKGDYPYLVANHHYLRRAHTALDNVPWLREAMPNPAVISKADADEKGIKTGDVILIWNDNGKVIRPVQVSRRIMPGTLQLPHGAAVDIDEQTGIDRAGADNYLCSPNKSTASANNGWNSTLVNFEKYDGTLEADCQWKQRIVFED